MRAPPVIVCVDCGEDCHLLSKPPPDGEFLPGDVIAYRCSGCMDRWDVVIPEDDEEADGY
ncbi:MAG TPA: hypothetical protein VF640_10395 [Acidimicrobiales bacterium]